MPESIFMKFGSYICGYLNGVFHKSLPSAILPLQPPKNERKYAISSSQKRKKKRSWGVELGWLTAICE
jgi:hypothetical protein